IVGIASADVLFASDLLLGFAIISAAIKSAFTGTTIALLIAAGGGLTALPSPTKQGSGRLTVRARAERGDTLWAAAKIVKPALKLGKAALALMSRAKTGTFAYDQIVPS